jgi:hypothetical protein
MALLSVVSCALIPLTLWIPLDTVVSWLDIPVTAVWIVLTEPVSAVTALLIVERVAVIPVSAVCIVASCAVSGLMTALVVVTVLNAVVVDTEVVGRLEALGHHP